MTRVDKARIDLLTPFELTVHIFGINRESSAYYHGQVRKKQNVEPKGYFWIFLGEKII